MVALTTGEPAACMSFTADEQENRKALDAALLEGASVIVLDNVEAEVTGPTLCQIITQPMAKVRILGRSESPTVPCRAFVLANGNNLVIAADMTRRTIVCRLHREGEERPEKHAYAGRPLKALAADRGRYVAAALTILRAYHVAGCPGRPSELGSFEAWSNLVRGALVWLGEADPADSMDEIRAADPRRNELLAVLGQWDQHIGDAPVSSKELIDKANAQGAGEFREALLAVAGAAGNINTQRLGKWLRKQTGKLVGTLSIVPERDTHANRIVWRLNGGQSASAIVVPMHAGQEFDFEAP